MKKQFSLLSLPSGVVGFVCDTKNASSSPKLGRPRTLNMVLMTTLAAILE